MIYYHFIAIFVRDVVGQIFDVILKKELRFVELQ